MPKIHLWTLAAPAALVILALVVSPTPAHAQCGGTTVTVALAGGAVTCPSTYTDTVTWSVTGAAGVLFDVSLNGTLVQQNIQLGSTGSWPLNLTVPGSGTYTLTIQIYPIVATGSGYQTCLANGVNTSQTFTVACPLSAAINSCTWTPPAPVPPGTTSTGTCTATVSGGTPPYTLVWLDSTGTAFTQFGSATTWTSPVLTCVSPGVVQLTTNDSAGSTVAFTAPCP